MSEVPSKAPGTLLVTPRECLENIPIPPVAKAPKSPKPHIHYHKDGSIWAKGQLVGDTMVGYWEWFRKDGTRMRSGYFDGGKQTGEWTTYNKKGEIYKVTKMKPRASKTLSQHSQK